MSAAHMQHLTVVYQFKPCPCKPNQFYCLCLFFIQNNASILFTIRLYSEVTEKKTGRESDLSNLFVGDKCYDPFYRPLECRLPCCVCLYYL